MPITVSDLKFRQAERMTDEADGGGRMSAVEIAPGGSNGVFDDISDVDRAAGGVSIRKVYAHVASDADDKYLDAGVVIFKPPTDDDVSVLAFSTGDFYDERTELKNRLESQISRGARMQAYLWGPHITGQRSVTLWARPDIEPPSIGERIDIAEFGGDNNEDHAQIVWVTRVTVSEMTFTDDEGAYQVQRFVCEIAEGLRYVFTGQEPSRTDDTSPSTKIFETRYSSGTVPIFGIKPLVDAAAPADRSVMLEGLYTPLIPTAFAETAIPDAVPGGGSAALVAANESTISRSFSGISITNNASLYLGSPVYPGTLTITVGGSDITDSGGALRFGGSDVGTIDYNNGIARFNELSPTGTSATVTFQPAAAPARVTETAQQYVTVGNRGFVWVITLRPLPAPGSLNVAYRVNNEWYVLFDRGNGTISGIDSSYGIGSLSYATGTVTITTGALPDVDSTILYAWTTPMQTFARGGEDVAPLVIRGTVANTPVLPGTVSITWGAGASGVEDAAGDGVLVTQSGLTGGTGRIRYDTGEWWLQPDTVPLMGTEFTVAYDSGDESALVTDTWAAPALDASGNLTLTLSEAPKPGTLKLDVTVELDDWVLETGDDVSPKPNLPVAPKPSNPVPPTKLWYALASLPFPWGGGYAWASVRSTTGHADKATATTDAQSIAVASSVSGVLVVGGTYSVGGVNVTITSATGLLPSGAGPHAFSRNPSARVV